MIKEYLNSFRKPSPEWVEKHILHLVRHVWANVPFYRAKMENAGISPADITSLEDYVHKFPATSAAEYRAFQQAGNSAGLLDLRLPRDGLLKQTSSGSSGVPLTIHRTNRETEIDQGRALWHLIRAGLRPWHRVMAVLAPREREEHVYFLQRLGIFHRTVVHYNMPLQEIAGRIQRDRINVIYGQKSFIRLIAEHYRKKSLPAPKLHLLIPGAEKSGKADRAFLADTFRPARYCEFYGANETNLIAARFDEFYQPDYRAVFFSLADIVPQSEDGLVSGSMLVTSLVNEAQPILKLELGDRVLVRNYDRLTRLGAAIVEIEGRNNDYLILPDGEKISGATLYIALEKLPFMRQFRVVQDSAAACTVLLKIADLDAAKRLQIEELLQNLFMERIRYRIEYVEEIPIDPNGKTKIIISRMKP